MAHADDILYLRGAFDNEKEKYQQEYAVSQIIQQYWVNFATNLNPNGKGLPQWPVFNPDPSQKTVMQFKNGGTSLVPVPNAKNLKLLEDFSEWVRSQRTIKP